MRTRRLALGSVILPLALLASGCGAASVSAGTLVVLAALAVAAARGQASPPSGVPGEGRSEGTAVGVRPSNAIPVLPGGAPMPPPPCDGTRVQSCEGGRVQTTCCPSGEECPTPADFADCGYGACVPGGDTSQCLVREAWATDATDEGACTKGHGSWEKACVARKVTMACLPPVPTNYTGPPRNPPFVTCLDDRCAPTSHPELCFPAKGEVPDADCFGAWQKACVKGRVEERCVPALPLFRGTASVRPFTDCGAGRCTIGGAACP